jgi:hypothetical protein
MQTTLHGQQAALSSADPARASGAAHLGRQASRGGAQARTRPTADASQDPAAPSGAAPGTCHSSRAGRPAVVPRGTGVLLPSHRHLARQQGSLPHHSVLGPGRSHSPGRRGGRSHGPHPRGPGAGHPLRARLQPRRSTPRVGLVGPLPQPPRHHPARGARLLRLRASESLQTLARCAGGRFQIVGPVVRRMATGSAPPGRPFTRVPGEDVAGEGRLAPRRGTDLLDRNARTLTGSAATSASVALTRRRGCPPSGRIPRLDRQVGRLCSLTSSGFPGDTTLCEVACSGSWPRCARWRTAISEGQTCPGLAHVGAQRGPHLGRSLPGTLDRASIPEGGVPVGVRAEDGPSTRGAFCGPPAAQGAVGR